VSESRTLEASPRKLARARARLGRPTSRVLTAAATLGVFALAAPPLAERALGLASRLWSSALAAMRTPAPSLPRVDRDALLELAALGGGTLLALAFVASGVAWLQGGAIVRFAGGAGPGSAIEIDTGVGADRAPRAAIALATFTLVFVGLAWPWSDALRGMLDAWQRAPSELLPIAGTPALALFERAALALAVAAALELALQTAVFRRRLRMSRRELQEEARATEGDPHARAERRRRAHEVRMQATLLELSEVSAIVFDSERAIGLRVSQRRPVVWLQADGELARMLRREGAARQLPLVHDSELAVALAAFQPNELLPNWLAQRIRTHLGLPLAESDGHD